MELKIKEFGKFLNWYKIQGYTIFDLRDVIFSSSYVSMDYIYNNILTKNQKKQFLEIFEYKLKKEKKIKKEYSVFVGGTEVNDFFMTKEDAEDLRDEYIEDGYDDAEIMKYKPKLS